MKVMFEYGIDINIKDSYDRTAKDILVQNYQHPMIVSWLCSNGIETSSKINASPIEASVIIEKSKSRIDDNDDKNNCFILQVEGKDVLLYKNMISYHSPILDNMIKEYSKDQKQLTLTLSNTSFNSLENVLEWLYTEQISCNDIEKLIRTWYLSDILKIRPLSRYIQTNKIVPQVKIMASLSNFNDIDTILSLYDQSSDILHGRYVKRFCASLILENLHIFRQHERYKELSIQEFANVIQTLYNDIEKLQLPSINQSLSIESPLTSESNVKLSPSLSTVGSMIKYITNVFKRNYIPVEDILLTFPREQKDMITVPVCWRAYKMFKKEGTMNFYKNYLIYGDNINSYAIDYQNISQADIQLKEKNFSLKEKKGKRVYYFESNEIDRVYQTLISKFGNIVHF